MRMDISFPGGLAVDARFGDFTIPTDQPEHAGGGGSAPAPFDLFLASIGTCAGLFALRFCRQRGIATEGLGLVLHAEREQEPGPVSLVRVELRLPDAFPDKYRDAILRAVDQCTVKRHVLHPPLFVVELAQSVEQGVA
jgi:ribosomal protein S12 methylthiotransferase accessory factor